MVVSSTLTEPVYINIRQQRRAVADELNSLTWYDQEDIKKTIQEFQEKTAIRKEQMKLKHTEKQYVQKKYSNSKKIKPSLSFSDYQIVHKPAPGEFVFSQNHRQLAAESLPNLHFAILERQRQMDRCDFGCRVQFLNCGQGDAIVLENAGEVCLIDFGAKGKEAEAVVAEALRKTSAGKAKYGILTHPHIDHAGACSKLLGKVDKFVASDCGSGTDCFADIFQLVGKRSPHKNRIVQAGKDLSNYNFSVGNMKFEVVGPPVRHNTRDDQSDANNNSIVLKMTYKDKSFLFAGDMELEGEKEIHQYCQANGISLECDVLKLPHHGAENCTSKELLQKSDLCVASLGNQYNGQLSAAMLKRIQESGSKLLRTDRDGTVTFAVSPEGKLSVHTEKGQALSPTLAKTNPKNLGLANRTANHAEKVV